MQEMGTPTPEEMKKGMEPWMEWAKNCGEHLVDLGTPLSSGQKLNPNNQSTASGREVCGYSVLQAENMGKAKSLMEGHPHLMWRWMERPVKFLWPKII